MAYNAGYITTADVELNRVLCQAAAGFMGNAQYLAYRALHLLGNDTPDEETLQIATVLAQEALDENAPPEQEPPPPTGITFPDSPMQAGRLRKALDRKYRFSSGTMALGEFLQRHELARRSLYIRHYATKKRQGCYAELTKPKHVHSVWWLEDGQERGIDVPKIVFDALADVPSTMSEQYHGAYL